MEKLTALDNADYNRFQIIVFHSEDPDEPLYIKRIIGLPGETVQIENGTIYINGEPLQETYGNGVIQDSGIADTPIILKDDEYFVLGDNRNNSNDSRYIGPIQKNEICGRIVFRLFPFSIFL